MQEPTLRFAWSLHQRVSVNFAPDFIQRSDRIPGLHWLPLNTDCPYVRQRTDNSLFDLVDFVGSILNLAKTGVSGLMDNPGCIQYSSTIKI